MKEPILSNTTLTEAEKKLLVYLESVQVNREGRIDGDKITEEEKEIMKRWADEGLIEIGYLATGQQQMRGRNKRVRFLQLELWGIAWAFRKEMAERFGYPW